MVVGQLGWKWIERSVLQLLLLKTKGSKLLLMLMLFFSITHVVRCPWNETDVQGIMSPFQAGSHLRYSFTQLSGYKTCADAPTQLQTSLLLGQFTPSVIHF